MGTVPSGSRTRPGPRSSPFPCAQQEALMGLEPPPGRLGSGCIGRQSRQVNCQSSHLPGLWIHLQPAQAAIPVPAPAPLVHWCPPPSSAADHYLAEASAAPGRVMGSFSHVFPAPEESGWLPGVQDALCPVPQSLASTRLSARWTPAGHGTVARPSPMRMVAWVRGTAASRPGIPASGWGRR